jgi:hypothetical protein
LDEDKHDVEKHGYDGTVGVCPVLEGKEVFETLLFDSGAETERGETDGYPG